MKRPNSSRRKKKTAFARSVERGLLRAAKDARKTAKLHGTPIVYLRNGRVVAERL
jgi:hypothetical protein